MFRGELTLLPQRQPDQPDGQQAAEFRAALGRGHHVGRQGIWAFHGIAACPFRIFT